MSVAGQAEPRPVEPTRTGIPNKTTSQQLLGEKGELIIDHQGRQYRLRVTQNGKLILTA